MVSSIVIALVTVAVVFLLIVAVVAIVKYQGNRRLRNSQEQKEGATLGAFKVPSSQLVKKKIFNPDEVFTFEKEDYQTLYKYFKDNTVIKPDKDPYAFNQLCAEVTRKFILLGLNNTEASLKNSYSFSFTVKPRVQGVSIEDWSSILHDYRMFKNQTATGLSDYIYFTCSLYLKALTGKVIFSDYPILTHTSNYGKTIALISRECESDNYHNKKYGPAILLYFIIHMQTVVKIMENQKRLAEGGNSTHAYLVYLEDILGLTKLDIDKGTRDFIKPPSSPIETDVAPQHLLRGILSNG